MLLELKVPWSPPDLTSGLTPGHPWSSRPWVWRAPSTMSLNLVTWKRLLIAVGDSRWGRSPAGIRGWCPGSQHVLLLAAAQLGTSPLQALRPQAAPGHPWNGRGKQWEREVAPSQSAHGVVSCVVLAYYVWYPTWMRFVSLMTTVEHPFRCLAAILYLLWWGINLNLLPIFNRILYFLIIEFLEFLHTLNTRPLGDLCFTNIFS